MQAKLETAGVYTPDTLIAGNAHLLVGKTVTIAGGQVLPRGALLGLVTDANSATAPQAASGNTGQATVSTPTVTSPSAHEGEYTIEITAEKGTDPAAFTVTDPKGNTAAGVTGVAFAALGVSFTMTEGANPNEADVGDSWTFTVTASAGEYRLSASAASDGSQTPDCILAQDVDTTAGDQPALVYKRGDFDANAITLGTGHTLATVTEALRSKGIALLPTVI